MISPGYLRPDILRSLPGYPATVPCMSPRYFRVVSSRRSD